MTITVSISGPPGSPTLTTLSVTLGCIDYRAALHQLNPSVKADYPITPAISCGSLVDQAENRAWDSIFRATVVRVTNTELIIGNPPEQFILNRTTNADSTSPVIDLNVYGTWQAAGDDPGLSRLVPPPDSTLTVTVTEAPSDTGHPWDFQITLGCQVWDTDILAAHPLSAPLPDQMITDCGPLAYAEQNVAFTILNGDWPLAIDGGDLVFGAPAHRFYLHPAN